MSQNKVRKHCYSVKFKLLVVDYAEKNSGGKAATKFGLGRSSITDWMKQKTKLQLAMQNKECNRKKLSGGGAKIKSYEVEESVLEWVQTQRENKLQVSRRMIRRQASELNMSINGGENTDFKASPGWLNKFMKRNNLSLRRKTTVCQKDPEDLCNKVAAYLTYISNVRKKNKISGKDVVTMDETAVYFDMPSNYTVSVRGAPEVAVKTTGNEKKHFTVILAAHGDGRKLKPYIVFKESKREVAKLKEEFKSTAVIRSNKNGWMDDDLTIDWLDNVYGHFSFGQRLLAWDSFKCHLSEATKNHLTTFNTKTAVMPGGLTKYLQAPDVSWNKPFKDKMRGFYEEWMRHDENKDYTRSGNLKAPNKHLIVEWILAAWNSLSTELITTSFKICGLTTDVNGEEDDKVHCIKDGQPCRPAWHILLKYRDEDENDINLEEIEDEEENEANGFFSIDSDNGGSENDEELMLHSDEELILHSDEESMPLSEIDMEIN